MKLLIQVDASATPIKNRLFGRVSESYTRRNASSTTTGRYESGIAQAPCIRTAKQNSLVRPLCLPISLYVSNSSVLHTMCGQIHAVVSTVETGFLTGIPTTMVEDIAPSLKALDKAVMEHPEVRLSTFHVLKNSLGGLLCSERRKR